MPRSSRTDGANSDRQTAGRARWIVAFAAVLLSAAFGAGIALGAQGEAESDTAALSAPPQADPGVEIKADRTETSQTFLLPDGALQTRIFETPINYRDAEGNWKPIGDQLEEVEGGGFSNGPNSFDASLPERLGAEPVRLSTGGEWVSAELLRPESQAAHLEGENAANYKLAGGDTSFSFSGLANGLKEGIVIADPSQPSSFDFELRASVGVKPTLTEEGAVEFQDDEGTSVAMLPPPVMFDSAPGSPAVSGDAHYELHPEPEEGWRLTVAADRPWLEAEDRSWPVELDPTMHIASPALDCTFGGIETQPSESWGLCGSSGQQYLYAAFRKTVAEWRRAVLRFDLSAIPTNAYVSSATLGLHAPSAALNTSGLEARQTTRTWTSQVNWFTYNGSSAWTNHGGDFTSTGAQVLTSERGGQAGWWNLSQGLAPLAQGWVSGSIANQGVLVKLIDDKTTECGGVPCVERSLTLDSSAASESGNRPYLDVVYYPPASAESAVISPTEGQKTARRLKLRATAAPGTTGVTFQYRELAPEGNPGFQTIPESLVRDANDQQISWPLGLENNLTAPVYFDAAHATAALRRHGGEIEVRALFDGPIGVGGYSPSVKASVDRFVGAPRDAGTSLGPGSLNLLTGNFNVSRTDVSIAGFGSALQFSRSLNSREATSSTGVLGQGWKPSVPVEAAGGAEWQKLTEVIASPEEREEGIGDYALLTDLEGYESAFEKVGEGYVSPPEFSGWLLTRLDSTHLSLADPDGNRTIFENSSGGNEYLPVAISQTGGSTNSTQMVYEIVAGKRRLSMVIAPSASGVTCDAVSAKTKLGCRALTFTYQSATVWGAPAELGDRLSAITYYGPLSATSISHWEVAKYGYNSEGRLTQEWDPRLGTLIETYAYLAGGQIQTITPPGQEPWTLEYGDYDEEQANTGRLVAIKRPTLLASPSIAQTTIVYGTPLSGSAAPYEMSGSAVAAWGQHDIPTDATAIFPPDQIPTSPPSSYSRAAIYYMDAEGQLVNSATPAGAGTAAASITTAEPDAHGNVVRELSAQNRLRALAAEANSVARSHELETKRSFSADGTEMQEEWGPLHQVRLESGATEQARLHRTVKYDEGAPTPPPGTPMPHLPTRETTGASIPGQGTDADQRVTETRYDWSLRKPTDTVIDPGTEGQLNLRTHISYDAVSGLPTERRLPANPDGGDAHTTKTIYYSAGAEASDPACQNKPAWANLPCKLLPAAQPGTPGQPELLVTRVASYNKVAEPLETIESPGGGTENTRRTIFTYDALDREATRRQIGGGTAVSKVQTLYSSTTGLPTTKRFVCEVSCEGFDNQATITTYDKLGRVTSYQDADGNTATATYDLLGRPATISDGKGTQTFGYDPTSALLVSLQDSAAGTFTAAYNADGSIVEEGLPDGLLATSTYDETGAPTHLSYEKKTFCSLNCTWLEFGAERSIYGQVLAQTSTLSSQQYSYDKAGRLTLTKDTPQGGGCTTRSYSYEPDSNRTALVTRAPGIGGVCDLSSEGTVQKYSYDAGDRLIDSGIAYDNFGRITSLPAADAGGSTLSTTYYSNDLIASQSQGSITNSYQLDGALRQRQRTETGGSEPGTEIYHYAGGSDSPTWIDRGSSWQRNIVGIGKELAAIQDSAKGTTLELTNLHGDIVATASPNPEATKLLATFEFDEFGNPKQGAAGKYGWLGGKQRRTELPSGVIQMGVRSYVPAIGRFISTDPVPGGSANVYDYANQDPVNGFDLDGRVTGCGLTLSVSSRRHRLYVRGRYTCPENAWPTGHSVLKATFKFERHSKGLKDEIIHGKFETKSAETWKPSNPSDPQWRKLGFEFSYYCGDIGRQYQYVVTLNVIYQKPSAVGGSTEYKTLEARDQAVCRR